MCRSHINLEMKDMYATDVSILCYSYQAFHHETHNMLKQTHPHTYTHLHTPFDDGRNSSNSITSPFLWIFINATHTCIHICERMQCIVYIHACICMHILRTLRTYQSTWLFRSRDSGAWQLWYVFQLSVEMTHTVLQWNNESDDMESSESCFHSLV